MTVEVVGGVGKGGGAKGAAETPAQEPSGAAGGRARTVEGAVDVAKTDAEGGAAEIPAGGGKPPKRPPQAEAERLSELVRDEKNVREVTDETLTDDYDVEVSVDGPEGRHAYRRKRSGGSWCRFSTKECGFSLSAEDEANVQKAAPQAADEAAAEKTAEPATTEPAQTTETTTTPEPAQSPEPTKAPQPAQAPEAAKASAPDPLDAKIAEAQRESNEARHRTLEFQAERAAESRSRKGGPSKLIWNVKDRLWLWQRAKAYPNRRLLEQVTIIGVKDAAGTMRPAKAFRQEGRILDFAELNGDRVLGGDLKSNAELIASVKGGVKRPGKITGKVNPKTKLGLQKAKEARLVKYAAKTQGKLVLRGRDVRTGESVTVEVGLDKFDSTVVTYDDFGRN